MLNHSNTRNAQADQPQELVPLTPEVAREIEKLLIKNAEALERLRVRHNAGRNSKEIKRQQRAAQFGNS
jgi:hypothetical protein